MGDVMMLILGCIVGLLCEAWTSAKLIQDAYHTAYQDGLRDGAEEARVMWENQTEENVLFAKDAEEAQEGMSCGFCESIESQLMLDKGQDKRLRSEYWARYAKITYRDLDQEGEWSFAGHITGGLYPLNFCPECGRRIVWNDRSGNRGI